MRTTVSTGKRAILSIAAGIILVACAAIPTAVGQNKGSDTLTIPGGSRGNIELPHHLHQAVTEDCQVCHKDFPQEKGALQAAKTSGALKKKQVMNGTCLACHRAMKKAGEETGPVSCNACHKK